MLGPSAALAPASSHIERHHYARLCACMAILHHDCLLCDLDLEVLLELIPVVVVFVVTGRRRTGTRRRAGSTFEAIRCTRRRESLGANGSHGDFVKASGFGGP